MPGARSRRAADSRLWQRFSNGKPALARGARVEGVPVRRSPATIMSVSSSRDEDHAESSDTAATAEPAPWRTGRLSRARYSGVGPGEQPDDEPGWVEGWFHERLLDGVFEDPADGTRPDANRQEA